MTTKNEALRMALEALELEDMACRYEKDPTPQHIAKAITAIREALAQPEHPYPDNFIDALKFDVALREFDPDYRTMYLKVRDELAALQQRTWVGLTDEDKQIAFDDTQEGGGFWEFADAIEAKLRKKNHG